MSAGCLCVPTEAERSAIAQISEKGERSAACTLPPCGRKTLKASTFFVYRRLKSFTTHFTLFFSRVSQKRMEPRWLLLALCVAAEVSE